MWAAVFQVGALWAALPSLVAAAHGRYRRSLVLIAFPVPFVAFCAFRGWLSPVDAAFYVVFLASASLSPIFSRRRFSGVRRHYFPRVDRLKREKKAALESLSGLRGLASEASEDVERVQGRFSLLHRMSSQMQADQILEDIGRTWCGMPGVRGCLLLRHSAAGKWNVVFAQGLDKSRELAQELPALCATAGLRIRRYAAGTERWPDGLLGNLAQPPFLLVPFSWERDVMAVGYVEIRNDMSDATMEELAVDKKLAAIGLRRAFLYDLLQERSRYDTLTGAFLRRVLMERLTESVNRAERYKTGFFVGLLDVDHFKQINDRWGHPAGDRVLQELARTVRETAPPGVYLGRFGGDEFALGIEVDALSQVEAWLARFWAALQPVRDAGKLIPYSCSLGLVKRWPGEDVEHVMARADKALYQAKAEGRNRWVVGDGT